MGSLFVLIIYGCIILYFKSLDKNVLCQADCYIYILVEWEKIIIKNETIWLLQMITQQAKSINRDMFITINLLWIIMLYLIHSWLCVSAVCVGVNY